MHLAFYRQNWTPEIKIQVNAVYHKILETSDPTQPLNPDIFIDLVNFVLENCERKESEAKINE